VQLIEASTDAHIWAENYDRKLDDVFAIQSEIALAIADQLKLTLSPELQANLSERPTQNQEAYALYLRALDDSRSWRGASGFQTLIALLEPAVQLDPDFLVAKVLLADAYGRMHWLRADPDGSFASKAQTLAAEITRRWPDHPETQMARGQIHYSIERDYARALAAFEAVQTRLPKDPRVMRAISASLKRLGRTDEFLHAAQAALVADPESPLAHGEVFLALLITGRYDEALAHAERMKQKFPEDVSADSSLARIKLYRNQDIDAYLDFGKRAGSLVGEPTIGDGAGLLVIARFVRGDFDGALTLLQVAEQSTTLRQAASLSAYRAELLRLMDREPEADALARSAYDAIRESTDVEQPRADFGAALWYAQAARIAAQAGERTASERWRDKALASPAPSIEQRAAVAGALSAAARALGDQQAAWQLLSPFVGNGFAVLPDAQLRVFKPYYDQLFGESASYRAYMAKIAAENR
jgi:Flp pilus assembly protein TadD